jgi:hypothetical protein
MYLQYAVNLPLLSVKTDKTLDIDLSICRQQVFVSALSTTTSTVLRIVKYEEKPTSY